MWQHTQVTMSMRELDRLKCIQAVVDGGQRVMVAAGRLHLSTRQVRRLASRYRLGGHLNLAKAPILIIYIQ